MRIAILGCGNGGQAMAAHLAWKGHDVALWGRNKVLLKELNDKGSITMQNALAGEGRPALITSDLETAVNGAEIIMITTTATAHAELAVLLTPFLKNGQTVLLNPGRTCGAIVFRKALNDAGLSQNICLGETQTLIYACRVKTPGIVNIIGVKKRVLCAALPASDTPRLITKLSELYNCFIPVGNVLETSLENIGAIFHPAIVLFNAAAIERGEKFYFYRDMTPRIANFIEKLDEERISLGKKFGIQLTSAKDWVVSAYDMPSTGDLGERMKNNPAYFDIQSPECIDSRQLSEDIPTGIVPCVELGRLVGLEMPLFSSVMTLCSTLLEGTSNSNNRTLQRMGFEGKTVNDILTYVK